MNFLANLKIGQRLALGFAVVLVLSIVTTIIGIVKLDAVADAAQRMLDEPVKKDRLISAWNDNIAMAVLRTTAIIKSSDPSLVQVFAANAAETDKKALVYMKEIEPMLTTPEEKQTFEKMMEVRRDYKEGRKKAIALKEAGQVQESNEAHDKVYIPAAQVYQGNMAKLVQIQRDRVDELSADIQRTKREAVEVAQRVAAGDLTADPQVGGHDEIGQLQSALKHMNDQLLRMVREIRGGSDAIASASSEIAAGNHDLSNRTEQQAGALEETASSMEELNSTVTQTADNARQATQLAATASAVAGRGGAVVAQVVDTMASIDASSKKIADIIGVIDGIAFQTNILALKEIKELITDSVEKVDSGARLVTEAGATMNEIVGSVQRVTDIIGEITAATEEQRAGIGQINQAVNQMDRVTQQNAALVEEAAAASAGMQDQAQQLAQVVSVFKLGDDDMGRAPAAGLRREPEGGLVPRLG